MRECAGCDGALREFIANIRRAEAVSDTHKLRLPCAVAVNYSLDPYRNCFIGKRSVLLFPGFVVKVRGRLVVAVFAVFPHGVLFKVS